MLLEGLFLPLTTPFFPDGRLNIRKLRQNVAHYSLTPAAGMVVIGSSGEANLLSDKETIEVLQAAIEAAAETKVMVAGVLRQSVAGTVALIDEAAAMGYDAALVKAPSRAGLSDAETRIYLLQVADHAKLPIVIAGEPGLALLVELAKHPQVLGAVVDTGSTAETGSLIEQTAEVKRTVTVTQVFAAVTRRMLAAQAADGLVSAASLSGGTALAVEAAKTTFKTRTKVVGFQVLAGGTEGMLAALEGGAVGVMPPFSAPAPQGCYEVYAAWKDGDAALAAEKQLRLVQAAGLIEGRLGVAGLKYGCDLNGYAGGLPRLPLLGLSGEQRAEVELVMAGLKS